MDAKMFEKAYNLDCSKFIEKKKNGSTELSYLSWAYAWAKFKILYPDATYEVVKFDGVPYMADPCMGIMVYTKVTAAGETHEMWLPVMDGANKAMKLEAYTYKVKGYENGRPTMVDKPVKAADMFDINKTIMRCLVKNLAMFGLGLSIYAGEDIPIPLTEDEQEALKAEMEQSHTKPVRTPKKAVEIKNTASSATTATKVTMDMYLAGKCKNIVAKLEQAYNPATATIDNEVISKAQASFAWDQEAFDAVVKEATRNAFSKDLNNA